MMSGISGLMTNRADIVQKNDATITEGQYDGGTSRV